MESKDDKAGSSAGEPTQVKAPDTRPAGARRVGADATLPPVTRRAMTRARQGEGDTRAHHTRERAEQKSDAVLEERTRVRPTASAAAPETPYQATVVNDLPQPSTWARVDSMARAAAYPNKKILKDRFVLLEMLGAGGMGNVYLAKDLLREEMEDSHPLIAIKVLNDECRSMPGALQSLQREAKKAQALSHPNIVTVYDFDRDGETAFITMEYIDGQELKQCLRDNKRMPHAQAMHVIERVARGLAYAHQQGFAHSDIKPANIFLAKDETVKILDFGIAKAFTEATKEKRSLADDLTEGALTPAYASLEMLQGASAIPADDVYSLACMAYEMIRGQHPFIGENGRPMPADVAKAVGAKVEPIPGLSRRHMKALRQGLAFDRRDRFADAGKFIDAIKARNRKRDFAMLAAAVVFAGAGFVAIDFGLEQVVPSLSSLKPNMANVVDMITEADEFLVLEDISSANRLYAEAWEETNYLTINDAVEREKAHAILQDRMNKLSQVLIGRASGADIDEYQLRELYVALDFLLRGKQTSNEKNIKNALSNINKRLAQFESSTH